MAVKALREVEGSVLCPEQDFSCSLEWGRVLQYIKQLLRERCIDRTGVIYPRLTCMRANGGSAPSLRSLADMSDDACGRLCATH